MEIVRDYRELLELAVSNVPHPIEEVVNRLVAKKIILPEAARNFLMEIR